MPLSLLSVSSEAVPVVSKTSRGVPAQLKNHRLGWFYCPIWLAPHKKKMFSIVVCGDVGAGKSYVAARLAEDLDVWYRGGETRFSIDRIAFSAKEFLDIVSRDWPIGSVIIFDDAGLGAFSREAMQQEVRDIAKIFQSIRYKRWIIILTLPALGMLDKVVRQLLKCYIEPFDLNLDLSLNRCKIRWISSNKYTGDIYFKKPVIYQKIVHPNGFHFVEGKKIESAWIGKPSDLLSAAMDEKKDVEMSAWRKRIALRAASKERQGEINSMGVNEFKKILGLVRAQPDKFRRVSGMKLRWVPELIYSFSGSLVLAKRISKVLNMEESGSGQASGGLVVPI